CPSPPPTLSAGRQSETAKRPELQQWPRRPANTPESCRRSLRRRNEHARILPSSPNRQVNNTDLSTRRFSRRRSGLTHPRRGLPGRGPPRSSSAAYGHWSPPVPPYEPVKCEPPPPRAPPVTK